nr:putative Ig domain-containing protein [Pleomorphomonas sp. NRK KF1]
MTATCTDGSPVTIALSPAAGALTAGEVGTAYSATFTASGGTAPYSYAVTAGALPAGLSLAANGALTGTPTTAGTANFTITATDANTDTGQAAYSLQIAAAPVTIALSPAAGALTAGEVGTAYSATFTASGGTAPYSYAVTAGALPAGLSLATNGALTGTPTTAGTANFTVTATDANTDTGQAAYSLQIAAAPVTIALSPAAGALTEAMADEDYSTSITASGGTGPYAYSITSGALPAGLVLNVSSGELSGHLDVGTEGNYSFTIQARDTNNVTASGNYTLAVQEREVTATDKQITVTPGSAPPNVDLTAGATGGPFLSAAIVSVEPANGGTALIVNGEFAQVGPPGPLGLYVKFTPNPAYSGQVTVGFTLTSSLGTSNVGHVIYSLSYDPVAVAEEIDDLVHGFVKTRQNLIVNTIRVPGLQERRRMQTRRAPMDARLSPSAEGVTLGVSTGLAQLNATEHAPEADPPPFNVWIDASLTMHNREENNNRWGSFAMISAGADYLLTERALVGVSFHHDRMSDPTGEETRLTGNGWLAGPYASLELGRGVFWDTSLLYGGSSNDIDTALWNGRFDTWRWMFDTSLTGQWYLDPTTTLAPKLRAVYLSETVGDYDVSNGDGDVITLDGFLAEQLRVSLGAELTRQVVLDKDLTLTPSLVITSGFSGLDGSGVFGSVGTGLILTNGESWSLDAALRFNVEGDGQTSGGAKLGFAVQF